MSNILRIISSPIIFVEVKENEVTKAYTQKKQLESIIIFYF